MPVRWDDWWDPPNPATKSGEVRVRQYLQWLNSVEGVEEVQDWRMLSQGAILASVVEVLVPGCVIPRMDHPCHGPRRSMDGDVLSDELVLLEDSIMVIWERGGAPPDEATEDMYSVTDISVGKGHAIATLLHGMFKAFRLSTLAESIPDMILWYNKVLHPYYKELRKTAELIAEADNDLPLTSVLECLKMELGDCSAWVCVFHTHCQPAYMLDVATTYWKPERNEASHLLANAGFCFSVFETYSIHPWYTLREYVRYMHPEFVVLQGYHIWSAMKQYPSLADVSIRALNFLDQSALLRVARVDEERKARESNSSRKRQGGHDRSGSPHAGYVEMLKSSSPSPNRMRVRSTSASPSKRVAASIPDPPPIDPIYIATKPQSASSSVAKMLQVLVTTHKDELLQLPISARSRAIVDSVKKRSSSPKITTSRDVPRWRGSNEKIYNRRELNAISVLKQSRRSTSVPTAKPVRRRSASSSQTTSQLPCQHPHPIPKRKPAVPMQRTRSKSPVVTQRKSSTASSQSKASRAAQQAPRRETVKFTNQESTRAADTCTSPPPMPAPVPTPVSSGPIRAKPKAPLQHTPGPLYARPQLPMQLQAPQAPVRRAPPEPPQPESSKHPSKSLPTPIHDQPSYTASPLKDDIEQQYSANPRQERRSPMPPFESPAMPAFVDVEKAILNSTQEAIEMTALGPKCSSLSPQIIKSEAVPAGSVGLESPVAPLPGLGRESPVAPMPAEPHESFRPVLRNMTPPHGRSPVSTRQTQTQNSPESVLDIPDDVDINGMFMATSSPNWGTEEALLVADLEAVKRRLEERDKDYEGSPPNVLEFYKEKGTDDSRSPPLVITEDESPPAPEPTRFVYSPGTTLLDLFEKSIEDGQLSRPNRAAPPPPVL
eukprot:TRINITY_DN7414_c0_g6_i1.p1 TRINITY_DN7414_c0_g6~~TRINITY_DN7414_c0_g6_i1.p1  ORF type:complete len:887 (+),score=121.48 TRINITY_DN7414_c0_g6_i1:42-2702(+)